MFEGSTVEQKGAERPEGPPAVADPVLPLRFELRHGPIPADGHEDRVVAEAAASAGSGEKGSLAKTLCGHELTARRHVRGHAPIASGETCGRDAPDRPDQLGEVALVRRVSTREPGAPRSGPASECVDLDTGVIRDGRDPQRVRDGSCLERSVLEVGLARLVDIREGARITIAVRDPFDGPVRADPPDLDQLLLVLRREGDPWWQRHPSSDTERLGLDLRELRDPRSSEVEELVQLHPGER